MALAGVLDGREGVGLGNGDEGVAFIVLQGHVIGRLVLLDEIDLQHQGLMLAAHHQIVEAGHLAHHQADARALILAVDVLTHTCPQIFGFAYVEHMAPGVFP